MTTGWKAVCFIIAIGLFVIDAAIEARTTRPRFRRGHLLLSLGLAVFVLPFAWDAYSAA